MKRSMLDFMFSAVLPVGGMLWLLVAPDLLPITELQSAASCMAVYFLSAAAHISTNPVKLPNDRVDTGYMLVGAGIFAAVTFIV